MRTIAADLAKDVFQLAIAEPKSTTHRRLSRAQFERFWVNQAPARVVMEACLRAVLPLLGQSR